MMDAKVCSLLREGRGLVEKGWTRGAYAVDSQGHITDVDASDVAAVCTIGSLRRASHNRGVDWWNSQEYDNAIRALLDARAERGIYSGLSDFNDNYNTGIDDVLGLFDAALKDC